MYNWQQKDWPQFQYDHQLIEELLFDFAHEAGQMSGLIKGISEDAAMETIVNVMVAEAIKTSEIEGEYLSRKDVMSSIKNNLGLNEKQEPIKDKNAQGVGELMVAVRKSFASALSEETLFSWHKMLFKKSRHINAGAWRKHTEPMQVVSGAVGKEKIHFEAPPSKKVPAEMKKFIQWFNDTAPGGKKEIKKAAARSAIAHLYFESIHPFEDGNGRIGRAIAEKALSQTIGRPVLLSLSQTIEADKKSYYAALKKGQESNEITGWMKYFIKIILTAQKQVKGLIDLSLKTTKFFDQYKKELNSRQLKAIKKMIAAEPEGFQGGMTATKYMSITRAPKPTATRDLQSLKELGVLISEGGGRSTSYRLNL